jgi:hypothetical protein
VKVYCEIKFPLYFRFLNLAIIYTLKKGASYWHQSLLDFYAICHGLKSLALAADMFINDLTACLIIGDIL